MFLIGAAVFDKLDGALARKLGLTEPLPEETEKPSAISIGGVLDDISDAVSFCIAPAWIFYITLVDFPDPVLQKMPIMIITWGYAVLGIVRLIYFTLDRHPIPGFFKGMPTPAAAILAVSPLIIFAQAVNDNSDWTRFWGLFNCAVMAVTAILMNLYPIRYLHLGRFMSRHPWFVRFTLLLFLSVFTPYFGQTAFLFMFLYALSPLVTSRIDPQTAARETRNKSAEPGQAC
jgi:CDP-diacylglycerol--serine O-phosphatidyltransferase